MALHMYITKLIILTAVIEGIRAKTYNGRLTENLPDVRHVVKVTHGLLLNYKKNFVEPDTSGPKWSTPPAGLKNLLGFSYLLPLAEFGSAHLAEVKMTPLDIQVAIQSFKQELDPIQTHIIPVLDDKMLITDYPPEIIDWLGSRGQFIMGSALNALRKSGVRSAPMLQDLQLAEWEELAKAKYMTLADQVETMTSDNTDGEAMSEIDAMAMTEITDEMLLAANGDEHIDLYQVNYDGTHYLNEDTDVELATEASKILKGYWDLMDVQNSRKSEKLRTQFVTAIAAESKAYWDKRNEEQRGNTISIIV